MQPVVVNEPVLCVRCGEDRFRVEYVEGGGPHVAECCDCGYRQILRRDGEEAGETETGRCINCGSYFEAAAGLSSQVCSARCDRALVADFNQGAGL